MTKKCIKCNKIKEVTEFYEYTHQNGRKYRKNDCKSCFAKSIKPYIDKYESKTETKLKNNERRKVYRKTLKGVEKIRQQRRRHLENNPEKYIVDRARRRARLNNLDFNITKEDIFIPQLCPILEIPLKIGTKSMHGNSPSLDRIDITKGYIKGNIKVISCRANTMKNDASLDEIKKFVKNIVKYIENNE